MSYNEWIDYGLTPLETAAGVDAILNGYGCYCGVCSSCELEATRNTSNRESELKKSKKFKEATKIIAGLNCKKEIKLILIHKVRQNSLEAAIVRYMAYEALPEYYSAILKNKHCIDILIEGILYKVCKIKNNHIISEQIKELSNLLKINAGRLTAYDRVTSIQQFIYYTVDQKLGEGSSRSIPVKPMKNALSAARLHLNIFDIIDRLPNYTDYIDTLSNASLQLEYNEPRPSTALPGKKSWPRWRVRHLRPLSYYFQKTDYNTILALKNMDESVSLEEFIYNSLFQYSGVNDEF